MGNALADELERARKLGNGTQTKLLLNLNKSGQLERLLRAVEPIANAIYEGDAPGDVELRDAYFAVFEAAHRDPA